MGLALLVSIVLPLLIYLYVRVNDAKIATLVPEAIALSPERWKLEEVKRVAKSPALTNSSASLFSPEELPPKTGRRYIVIGGVSACLAISTPLPPAIDNHASIWCWVVLGAHILTFDSPGPTVL